MVDDARLLHFLEQLLGGEQRAVEVGERQEDGELVAAEPRHGVGLAQRRAQPRRDALQDAVAGMVAERVVDLLEAVQVEQQQRERAVLAVGDARRLVETIVQERAVRQIGQRVVIRQVGEALFDAPALAPDAGVRAARARPPGSAASGRPSSGSRARRSASPPRRRPRRSCPRRR